MEADGHLVVMDNRFPAVLLRVDPRTGDRSIVSDATIGQGPVLYDPPGLAVEADGHLVVTDGNSSLFFPRVDPHVVRVDPRTGDRSIVSSATIGRGSAFQSPGSIAVEANGRVVIVDDSLKAVVRVNPTTGDRTLVSR